MRGIVYATRQRAMHMHLAHFFSSVFCAILVAFTATSDSRSQTTQDSGGVGSSKSANDVYSAVASSVVLIDAAGANQTLQGSGIVFSSFVPLAGSGGVEESTIVSNAHVVRGAGKVYVVQSGRRYSATVEFSDHDLDLAVLRVMGIALPAVTIAENTKVEIGQRVYAIGSPAGLENSISEGLVSGIRIAGDVSVIQTSASVSRGSSGGGLFDASSRLVGLITAKATGAEAIAFAIPAAYVAAVVKADATAQMVAITMKHSSNQQYAELAASSSFKRWIRTTRTVDGNPVYEEIGSIFRVFFSNTPPDQEQIKKLSQDLTGIFDRYRAHVTKHPPASAENEKSSRGLLKLSCAVDPKQGLTIREMFINIDLTAGMANGNRASISDESISFSDGGVRFDISRYSGTFIMSSGSVQVAGRCQQLADRKF